MCTIAAMYERALSARNELQHDVANCVEENKEQIIALNTNQLYNQGIDATGAKLPPYRSKPYAAKKAGIRGFSITDGYLTGEWQSGFNLSLDGGGALRFGSSDPKSSEIVGRRGWGNVFGLTDESKADAWDILRLPYIELLKARLQIE